MLNFGLAKEQLAALYPEMADRLKFVIVGDDVAVGKEQGKIVGRRYAVIIPFAFLDCSYLTLKRFSWNCSRIQDSWSVGKSRRKP